MNKRMRYGFSACSLILLSFLSIIYSREAGATFSLYQCEREYIDSTRNECSDGINLEECSTKKLFKYKFSYSGTASKGLYIYIGASCDNKENRDEGKCFKVPGFSNATLPSSGYIQLDIEPAWIVDPMSTSPQCVQGEGSNNIYLFILADDANQTIVDSFYQAVQFDTEIPSAPVNVKAEYGDRNVRVSWDVSGDNKDEWTYFRVLCYQNSNPRDASTDTSEFNAFDIQTDTSENIPEETEIETMDAETPPDAQDAESQLPEPDVTSDIIGETNKSEENAQNLDTNCPSGGFNEGDTPSSSYFCTDLLGSSTRSVIIENLQNNTQYKFAVIAYDKFRNPSLVSNVACATPQPVCDFWCKYRSEGGKADGYCFIATTVYGSSKHPHVKLLKRFRDEFLLKFPTGKWIVSKYYEKGPSVAKIIEIKPVLKKALFIPLIILILFAWIILNVINHPLITIISAGIIPMSFLFYLTVKSKKNKLLLLQLITVAVFSALVLPQQALAGEKKKSSKLPSEQTKKWEGSPQHFAAELKFGPYYPDVDDEFGGGASPFKEVFGSSSTLHGLFEIDYQFFRPPGISFAAGGLIGGLRFSGKALNAQTGEPSGEKTTLSVITTHLDAVIRIDALLRWTVIPLVPYFKGGLSYYLWWTTNHSGISKIDGKKGQGGTYGWNIQTGLMLCLDPLEPRAARTFDNEIGVNNSYIFGELLIARLDNFGQKGALNLSEMTWMIGLALEF